MRPRPRPLPLLLLLAFAVGCGTAQRPPDGDDDAGVPADAGQRDAGPQDAGACGPATCDGCCNQAGKCEAGDSSPTCGAGGAACVDCGVDGCLEGRCVPPDPIAGDGCEAPVALVAGADGVARARLDLRGLGDDTGQGCGAGGADGVASFDVAEDDTFVSLRVDAPAGVRPSVSLRTDCGRRVTEIGCVNGLSASAIFERRLEAGRYHAWVEASGTPTAPLSLTLRQTPIRAGDSCGSPRLLALPSGSATLQDSLDAYGPDELSCASGDRDAVYAFSLASAASVTVSLTPTTSGFDPILTLGTTCGVDAPVCGGPGPGAAETIQRNLAAGTHYVTVGSADGSSGAFDLSVNAVAVTVADGESCSAPLTLTFDSTGTARVFVPTRGRADDFALECRSGTSGPDSAYRFHVDRTSDFTATVRGSSVSSFDMLALRSACTGANLACGPGVSAASLAPGDYFLLVDSWSQQTSTLTLSASLSAPKAAGETCARPIALALSNGAAGGTARVIGTFAGIADDVTGTSNPDCTGLGSAPDLFYSFTIDRPLLVTTTLTRQGSTGSVELARVNTQGCTAGFAPECQAGTAPSLRLLLAAGTHLLRLQASAAIGFTLDVSAVAAPEGESCANAVPITFPAGGGTRAHASTTRGSTQENFNNACMGYDRPDRVYAVTLADPYSNLRITTTPVGSTNAPGFAVVRNCNEIVPIDESCETGTKATRSITVPALLPGTYHVWVKGPAVAGTDYNIEFVANPAPAGETCGTAIAIQTTNGAAGGTATITGTTVGASDEYYACRQIAPAFPDKVYAITIDRPLDLRLKMTPAAGARGALTLVDAQCRDTPDVCAPYGAPNDPVTTTLKASLAAGTHYVSVDHTSGGPGPYTLEVDLSPARPGETCANPKPLVFPQGAAGGTVRLDVDLRDFADSKTDECGGTGGDAYFEFTTDRPLDLRVKSLTTAGEPRVVLGEGCGKMRCGGFVTGTLTTGSLAPGRHVLLVDAEFQHREMPYSFEVSLTPPTPGDTCANALAVAVPPTGGQATVTGSTANAFSEHSSFSCQTANEDRVYTFTTTRTLSLVAKVSNPTGANAHALALLGSPCTTNATPTKCDPGKRDSSWVRAADLAPGTYFLVVDRAEYNAPQDFTLEVTLGDRPAGDTCASATPLGLPAGTPGEVTVTGDTRAFFHDLTPSCGASTGVRDAPDRVYSFTLAAPMNVRLFSKATTPGFRPTIALRKGCATTDADRRCGWTPSFSAETWTSEENLPAGTWYVVVDGYDAAQGGAYALTVRTSLPQAGDTCAAPKVLTLSNGTTGRAQASGAFADFFEHVQDCWNAQGADAVFAITTDRARRLHATVTASQQNAGPTLSVRKSPCAQSSSQLACERASYDGTARVATDLAAGTSYLIIKSPLAYPQGTFTLDVAVDDFAPGDLCPGALPLAFSSGAAGGSASATGDSYAFGADATLSCDSTKAPDSWFTFTTSRTLNLTATVRRQNTSDSFAIGLFPGCTGAQKACQTSGFSSSPLVLSQSALPAGTWLVVVRGGTTRPSGFTLDATLAP